MWASLRRGVSVCAMRLIFTESWFKCFQGRSVYNVTTEIIPLGNTAWIKRVLGAVITCADGLVSQWVASCRALGTDKFRGWHGHEPMRDVIHHRHSLAISSIFKWRPAQFLHECSRTDSWIPPRLIISSQFMTNRIIFIKFVSLSCQYPFIVFTRSSDVITPRRLCQDFYLIDTLPPIL